MEANYVQWGILGTGAITYQFLEALSANSSSKIVSICGRSLQNAEQLADFYNVKESTNSIDDLISKRPDVVYVATPNALHFEHCSQLIAAGISVLCEKPMGVSSTEVKELKRLAEEKSVFIMEGLWTLFLPNVVEIKRTIDSGSLGKINSFRASLAMEFDDSMSAKFDDKNGGGALLDLGVYCISLAIHFFGSVKKVSSIVSSNGTVETTAAVTLEHDNGVISQIYTSIEAESSMGFEISGSSNTILVEGPTYRPSSYEIIPTNPMFPSNNRVATGWLENIKRFIKSRRSLQNITLSLIKLLNALKKVRSSKSIPFNGNGYDHEINEVVSCILSGETQSQIHSLDTTLAVINVIEQIKTDSGL